MEVVIRSCSLYLWALLVGLFSFFLPFSLAANQSSTFSPASNEGRSFSQKNGALFSFSLSLPEECVIVLEDVPRGGEWEWALSVRASLDNFSSLIIKNPGQWNGRAVDM